MEVLCQPYLKNNLLILMALMVADNILNYFLLFFFSLEIGLDPVSHVYKGTVNISF